MTVKEAVGQIAYKKPQEIKNDILLVLKNVFVNELDGEEGKLMSDEDHIAGRLKSVDEGGIFRVYYNDVLIYDSSVNPPVIT